MGTIQVVVPALHPGQQAVHDSAARFRVAVCGRRWGKTLLGTLECLDVAVVGGRAWWVAPTYVMAREGWTPLKQLARQIPGTEIREADKEIILPGDGSVAVRSADRPDRLRGAGLDFVVVDEAAYVKGDTWTEALRPSLTDRQGGALFISTPAGYNWLKDLWDGADRTGWERWQQPTSVNPWIAAEEIEDARRDLGPTAFAQEFLAEFVEDGGTRIHPEWFRYYSRGEENGLPGFVAYDGFIPDEETVRYATVDLATSLKTSADYTFIAAVAEYRDRLLLLDVVRRRMEGPDIVPAIEASIERNRLGSVWIETAGFQLSVFQEAKRRGLPVGKLVADRDKVSRAIPLEGMLARGDFLFPEDAPWLLDLQKELAAFPFGAYDDQVDALAYAAAKIGRSGTDGEALGF